MKAMETMKKIILPTLKVVFAVGMATLITMFLIASFSKPDQLKNRCQAVGGERVTQDICVSSDGKILLYLRHGEVLTPGRSSYARTP